MILRATAAVSTVLLALTGGDVAAQSSDSDGQFNAEELEYGPRNSLEEGQEAEIWNPAMRKLVDGGPLIGGTVRATDPRTYCATAGAGYDFTWVEKQHEATDWEQVARMWRTCPGPAVPGVRVAYADEHEMQVAIDMGAAVIAVPTIDSVEEAREAIKWTYFPPMGRHSAGGGQGPSEIWDDVPGGYRETWNDNVVLILMIETPKGVEAAPEIAKLDGVDALFAASGDLGNFSGYEEGDPEYESLVDEVRKAAEEAGVALCGPLRWADRPGFTCFQASTEASSIRRGAEAELQAARAAFESKGSDSADSGSAESDAAALGADISAECSDIVYEADCYSAIETALTDAGELSESEMQPLRTALSEAISENPNQAEKIRQIVSESGVNVGDM